MFIYVNFDLYFYLKFFFKNIKIIILNFFLIKSSKNRYKKMEKKNIKKKIKEISKLLNCNICNSKITDPIMCFNCEQLYCINCIKENPNCPNCNNEINIENLKPINIFEDLQKKIEELANLINENEEEENESTYCYLHHNNKYKYLCLNCYRTYCYECFLFWGKEKDNHYNHDIFKLEDIKKYKLEDCIRDYHNLDNSFKEYSNFMTNFEKRIHELEFEKKIKLKEINENLKNEIIDKNDYYINNIKLNQESLDNLNTNYNNILLSVPNALEKIIKRKDYNGSEELYNKLLSEKEKLENIDQNLDNKINNIQFFSYEFPSIHIEGIANYDNEELYKDNFLYVIPECLVTLLIQSKNKSYVEFIIEISGHENNFLFNEYKTVLGIYNSNSSSFKELNLEMNITENTIIFNTKIDKTDFICCCNHRGDLDLKFYIFKKEE